MPDPLLNRWHRFSLRRSLLLVLLPGMLLIVGAEVWLTWRTAVDAANAAYDRSLYGAIKAMDANISTESGGLSIELPYRLLEFFELTAGGQVYYRVASEDGLVEIGNADLPAPRRPLVSGRPQFSDATYFDVPVRVGSYARALNRPLAGADTAQRVIIQVAETLGSRQDFTRALVQQAVARDVLLVLAATAMLVMVVGWALRPLQRLRHEVRTRAAQDLRPISADSIPADVVPLVEAINQHVARNRDMAEARRRFVDDASHQLRTPLTTLGTQVGVALREDDATAMHQALLAIKAQLDETVRQTNQMLALARADSAELAAEPVDLMALATDLTREGWAEARTRGIDLGLESDDAPLWVLGQAGLLKEALSNLLHNALRYTPRGGQVTVRLAAAAESARLSVVDNGAGIPHDEMPRASQRFFRARNATQPGTGLGLAIVRSIAERHGGRLELEHSAGGQGLTATLVLPRPHRDA
jgi:two-component system sensor histidine kinase TctE